MIEDFSPSKINFYNYILSKQKFINNRNNLSQINLFKTSKPDIITEIKEYKNFPQSNEIIKNNIFNKLKFDDLNKSNSIFSKTNKDFYRYNNSLNKINKSSNFNFDNYSTINNMNNYPNMNNVLFSYGYKNGKRKNDIYFINNNSDNNLYNLSFNINMKNKFNNNNILINLSNEKNKENNSKIIYHFKNMKMFYAHLELLISLYLKRNYKYFIEQIKKYKKRKIYENNINLHNAMNNQNPPIINLNNAHCSLYYSININKDNSDILKTLNLNDNVINIIRNNKDSKNNIPKKNYLNNKNEMKGNNNKTIYVPKNKTKKLKQIKSNEDKDKMKNNNFKNGSPIKEMNIDLKKMKLIKNRIDFINSNNNLKNEKNNLHLSNSKNNIYKRPKENNKNKKQIIKEIKIQKKELLLTPYETKTKNFFENYNSLKHNNNIKENNSVKKIYMKNNNSNYNYNDNIKTALFRNNSDINEIKNNSNFINNELKEILVKKITTNDKRINININYIILDPLNSKLTTTKTYTSLSPEHNLSLAIIRNTLLIQKFINKNFQVSDIFNFDNDKNSSYFNNIKIKEEKNQKFILLENFVKDIKDILINNTRKYLLNKYKKYIYLKRIISNQNKKIISNYFNIFSLNQNNNKIKSEIYHKINYNDDFNLNKKIKSKMNIQKNKKIQWKIYPNNISSKNKNYFMNRKSKNQIQSSNNFSCSYKYWTKEINITVHENKDNSIKKIISSYNKK